MEKFIGNDITLIIPGVQVKKLKISWQEWIKFDWNYCEVGNSYRTNSLSHIPGRYIVFVGYRKKSPKYRGYINIQSWIDYCHGIIRTHGISNMNEIFEFIKAWDNEDNKLINILNFRDDKVIIKEELAYSLGYEQG